MHSALHTIHSHSLRYWLGHTQTPTTAATEAAAAARTRSRKHTVDDRLTNFDQRLVEHRVEGRVNLFLHILQNHRQTQMDGIFQGAHVVWLLKVNHLQALQQAQWHRKWQLRKWQQPHSGYNRSNPLPPTIRMRAGWCTGHNRRNYQQAGTQATTAGITSRLAHRPQLSESPAGWHTGHNCQNHQQAGTQATTVRITSRLAHRP